MSGPTPETGVLRTPEHRFEGLVDYNFDPHYQLISHYDKTLRMHYVDEGPKDGQVVLLLHGCPAWSYLYRKLIPILAEAGLRAIAPDHIGCGRSDKLALRSDYSFDYYVNWMRQFIVDKLDLQNITLVCQDWGGPIGLRVLSEQTDRFKRVVATNTLFPNCETAPAGINDWPGETITAWIDFTANAEDMPVGQIIQASTVSQLPEDVLLAYDAPFPDASYKSAVLQWPSLIPVSESMPGVEENRAGWRVLEKFKKPFLTAFSDSDPTTIAWQNIFQNRVAGAAGQAHTTVRNAGHMVQEDQGEELAEIVKEFIGV